jgi:Delta3-Delta2-enoyl-CoA isomerase
MTEPIVETAREGDVTVVRMRAGENRFNPAFLGALNGALGAAEAEEGPGAVVLTGEGKFFSNGLDLEWMQQAGQGEPAQLLSGVHALFARVLTFPAPVVGALNGHTFAAGAMLALACDERVMRSDRGYFCLPEVDLGLPFTPGMDALVASRLTKQAAHRLMCFGERIGGEEAERRFVVERAVPEDEVVGAAVARAQELAAKKGPTLGQIKRTRYAPVLEALAGPPPAWAG